MNGASDSSKELKELKAQKKLSGVDGRLTLQEAKAEYDRVNALLNIAKVNKKRALAEYKITFAKQTDVFHEKHSEFKHIKRELCRKYVHLNDLQNCIRKHRIVSEFLRQCKRYRSIDIFMDINDDQKHMFHFKNGVKNMKTGLD